MGIIIGSIAVVLGLAYVARRAMTRRGPAVGAFRQSSAASPYPLFFDGPTSDHDRLDDGDRSDDGADSDAADSADGTDFGGDWGGGDAGGDGGGGGDG